MTRLNHELAEQSWPDGGLEQVQRCPVCDNDGRSLAYAELTDRVFFCAPGRWTLYRCERCGSHYLDPRPTRETIGLAYTTYFTHSTSRRPGLHEMGALRRLQRAFANGYRNSRYGTRDQPSTSLGVLATYLSPRRRALMDSELRHLPRVAAGGRVLDIGCGDGAFLEWARAAGWDPLGIDFDPAAVASARTRGLDVRCGGAEILSNEHSAFDGITLSHVLEHVHDPADLLSRSRDLLKPGGLLWIDTPNVASTGHRLFGRSWLGLDPPRHLVLFNPFSLRSLLASVGLTIVRTISRFEVCDRVFAASHRVAAGMGVLDNGPVPLQVRMKASFASWRARMQPDTSEFITVIATR